MKAALLIATAWVCQGLDPQVCLPDVPGEAGSCLPNSHGGNEEEDHDSPALLQLPSSSYLEVTIATDDRTVDSDTIANIPPIWSGWSMTNTVLRLRNPSSLGSTITLFHKLANLLLVVEDTVDELKTPSDGIRTMSVAPMINWTAPPLNLPIGITKYPSMMLMDVNGFLSGENATLRPYNTIDAIAFLAAWNIEMDVRIGEMTVLASTVSKLFPDHDGFYFAIENALPLITGSNNVLQGANGRWKSDIFAGEFIGHTLIAIFMEPAEHAGDFVLDLSGEVADGASTLQQLKARAARLAPYLLRAKGYLSDRGTGPVLMKVDIFDNETQSWLTFTAHGCPEQWKLAKTALLSLAAFTVEVFHTGIHLYGGTVTMSMQNSLSQATDMYGVFQPSALFATVALLEEVSLLHASHDAAFSGSVWNTTSIEEVWAINTDIAHFWFDGSLEEILGAPNGLEAFPKWWAGKAGDFRDPISTFAAEILKAVDVENGQMEAIAAQLQTIGTYNFTSTPESLVKLYRNMVFVSSICHTQMFSTREYMTQLLLLETVSMLPYLKSRDSRRKRFNPAVNSQTIQGVSLAFGTGVGFDSGFPELGSGFDTKTYPAMAEAVGAFQAQLKTTRASVEMYFSSNTETEGFLPSYYFPEKTPKPFGYGITQTVYV